MAIKFLNNQYISGTLEVAGATTFDTVANPGSDTDKFVVINGSGLLGFRTGAELLADIGGSSAATTVTSVSGTSPIISSGGLTPTISLDYTGIDSFIRSATSASGTTIPTNADIVFYDPDLSNQKVYYAQVADLPFSNTSGTVTSITAGADSGTGTPITTSGTITVAGGSNITTSVSGTTVTVNTDFSQYGWSATDGSTSNSIPSGTTVTWQGGTGINVSLNGYILDISADGTAPTGTGTAGKLVKWATTSTLGDGPVTISGSDATFDGHITLASDKKVNFGPSSYIEGATSGTKLMLRSSDDMIFQPGNSTKLTLEAGGDATFAGDILTNTDSSSDIGKTAKRWANLWVDSINGGTPTTGSGAANEVTYWSSAANITSDAGFTYNGTGRVSTDESFNVLKDGADTVADGPFFALKNAAGTKQYINQLDASNNIDYWYYNGSTWTQTISLLTTGGATFAGKVGIGTTNPISKLDIQGNNFDALRFSDVDDNEAIGFFFEANSGSGKLFLCTNSDYDAAFTTSDAKVTFQNNGNVGIGTDSPTKKLHVYNTAALDVALLESTQVFSTLAFKSSTNASTVTVGIDGAGNASFENKLAAGNMTFVTNGSERMRIDSSGNVGIGIAPVTGQKLQVKVTTNVNFTTSNSGAALRLNAVNDVVDATVPMEFNGSYYNFLGTGLFYLSGAISSSAGATFAGDVMPSGENLYDIGSAATRWEDIFGDQVYGRSIYVDEYIYHNGNTGNYIQLGTDTVTVSKPTTFAGNVIVQGDATVNNGLYPDTNLGAELGNSSLQFSTINVQTSKLSDNVYMGGGQLYIGTNLSSNIAATENSYRVHVGSGIFTLARYVGASGSGTWTAKLTIANDGTVQVANKATSTATTSGDGSTTLTTKGYIDGLITGATIYQGTWDPDISLNSGYGNPNLNSVTKTNGYYYVCSADGVAEPNGTGTEPDSWHTGDWVIYNDHTGSGLWQKIDNTSVLSGVGTGQTVAMWDGASSVTDSETLTNAPLTFSTNDASFTGTIGIGAIPTTNAIEIDGADGTSYIYLKSAAATTGARVGLNGDDLIIENKQGSGDMIFDTNSTERMRIDSAGRLSLGPDALDIQIDPASTNSGNNLIYLRGNVSDDKSSIQMNHYGYSDYHIGVGHVGDGKFNIANDLTGDDFVIDTAGNVGIGTASPDEKLHINKAVSAGSDNLLLRIQNPTTATDARVGIAFSVNDHTGANWDGAYIQAENDGIAQADLTFGSAVNNSLSQHMIIEGNTGNVGIGDPLAGEVFPAELLDIRQSSGTDYPTILVKYDLNTGNTTAPTASLLLSPGQFSASATAPRIVGYRTADFSSAAARSAGLKFGVSQNNVAKDAMWINEAQNVGIGTASPLAILDVKGVYGTPPTSGTTATSIARIGTGGPTLDIGIVGSAPYASWLQATDKDSLGTTYAMSLQPIGGDVGIGTTSPTAKLTIDNSISTTYSTTGYAATPANSMLYLNNTHGGSNTASLINFRSGSGDGVLGFVEGGGTNDADFIIQTDGGSNGIERFRILNNGNVCIGSTASGVSGSIDLSVGLAGTTTGGITLWSTTTASHSLGFGDATSGTARYEGYVEYDHNDNSMEIATNHTMAMRLDSSQNAIIEGGLSVGGGAVTHDEFNLYSGGTKVGGMWGTGSGGGGKFNLRNAGNQTLLLNGITGSGDFDGIVTAASFVGPISGGGATFTGDVGIKKAGADALLYLQNTVSVTSGNRADIAFYNSDISTVAGIRAAVDTSGTPDNVGTDLAFFTRAIGGSLTQNMTIKGGGNVGIGTSTTIEGRVDVKMNMASINWTEGNWSEVWDSAGTPGTYFDDAVFHIDTERAGGATGGIVGLAFSPGWQGHQNWGIYSFNTGGGSYSSGDLAFVSQIDNGTITERMRITSAGNVGIGTTTPGSYDGESDDLVVASGVNGAVPTPGITIACLGDTATTGRGALRFADGTSSNAPYRGALEYNHDGDDMSFRTAGSARMQINSTGDIYNVNGYYCTFFGDDSGNIQAQTGAHNAGFGYKSCMHLTTGTFNTGIGGYALEKTSNSSYNTGIGYAANWSNTTGSHNTTVGVEALGSSVSGTRNTVVGSLAADALAGATANYNVIAGYAALSVATNTSNSNVILGDAAGGSSAGMNSTVLIGQGAAPLNTADYTIAIGYNVMTANTTGAYNMGIGRNALNANTTGSANTAIGYQAMPTNITGNQNVALGMNAMYNTNEGNNVAIGYISLFSNTTGYENTAVGSYAGHGNVGGYRNVFIGKDAGRLRTGGNENTFIGFSSGYAAGDGASNTALGAYSGFNLTSGANNTLLGYYAGIHLNTGASNVVIGQQAFHTATTGSDNVIIGKTAGYGGNTAGAVLIGYQAGFSCVWNYSIGIGHNAMVTLTSGQDNVAIGKDALGTNATGNSNTVVGYQALKGASGSHSNNTVMGKHAGYYTTSGGDNTLLGINAGHNLTSGGANVAVGSYAMAQQTTAAANVAVGRNALYANVSGGSNVAIGDQALNAATSSYNTAVGYYSALNTAGGNANTTVGFQTLLVNTTGGDNTAVGFQSLYYNTASYNTGLGNLALHNNSTGSHNTGVGDTAGHGNTTGLYNVYLGHASAKLRPSGNHSVFIGYEAGYNAGTGNDNTVVGSQAGRDLAAGTRNTLMGYDCGANLTSGNDNIAIGKSAMFTQTTASDNVVVGQNALYYNVDTTGNTAIGDHALHSSTVGLNTALGYQTALNDTTGTENVFIGYKVGTQRTGGSENVIIGSNANGIGIGTGSHNTVLGRYAGSVLTSGHGNTYIGHQSGIATTTGIRNTGVGKSTLDSIIDGTGNDALGWYTGDEVTTGSNNLMLGNSAGSGSGPSGAITTGSNIICLGNNNHTSAYIKISLTVTSDKRDKTEFKDVPHGLDFVSKLKPTSYRFRKNRDTDETSGRERYGFLAQDVIKLEGNNPVIIDDSLKENLRYNESSMIPVLVKAIQELKAEIEELKSKK